MIVTASFFRTNLISSHCPVNDDLSDNENGFDSLILHSCDFKTYVQHSPVRDWYQ